jgi:hypothetical protein
MQVPSVPAAALVAVGLLLMFAPTASPAADPANEIEYSVGPGMSDDRQAVPLSELPADQRDAFETALDAGDRQYTVRTQTKPDFLEDTTHRLVPVETDDSVYAFQVVYTTGSMGSGALPWTLTLFAGSLLFFYGCYRTGKP